ncbi:MAG: hypothetical protein KDC00_06785, partial [Flavobacteriales bacterium]|nr:hypothetical protein [Flavobacteriales bacterium]
MLLPFVLLAIIAALIYLPPVQNVIRGKAVSFLKERTGTEVRLEHFALRYPIGIGLDGLYVEDQHGDTLLFAGTIKARLGLTALLSKNIVLGGIELSDVRASVVQQADSTFNFDFIVDAFASADTSTLADTTGAWGFSIEDVELNNIVFHLDLEPTGLNVDLALGS